MPVAPIQMSVDLPADSELLNVSPVLRVQSAPGDKPRALLNASMTVTSDGGRQSSASWRRDLRGPLLPAFIFNPDTYVRTGHTCGGTVRLVFNLHLQEQAKAITGTARVQAELDLAPSEPRQFLLLPCSSHVEMRSIHWSDLTAVVGKKVMVQRTSGGSISGVADTVAVAGLRFRNRAFVPRSDVVSAKVSSSRIGRIVAPAALAAGGAGAVAARTGSIAFRSATSATIATSIGAGAFWLTRYFLTGQELRIISDPQPALPSR